MRSLPCSWNNTLAKLGYTRRRNRARRGVVRRNEGLRLGIESLEDRRVLSISPLALDLDSSRPFTSTEIVVAFKGQADQAVFLNAAQEHGEVSNLIDASTSRNMFANSDTTLVEVKLKPGADPLEAVEEFELLDNVAWAQVNYIYDDLDPRDFTPNDPQYGSQYHHTLMQNNQAWDTTLGSSSILIGVTDDGFLMNHPDLSANIYTNPGEIASNGLDDDGNGFIDDVNGWDFWSNDNDPTPAIASNDHGTHVAGIAAARTNNSVGVSGTSGGSSIVPIRFYSTAGGGSWTSTVVSNAYHYAADLGVQILTTSYNVDGFASDSIFAAALDYIYDAGVLHFNSAGNNGQENPARQKFDTSLYVANTNASDVKSGSSNYGWGIDLSAPGTSILSTAIGTTLSSPTYEYKSGTSMAAPNAAGVAALIWSAHPTWSREQVAAQLVGTADNIDGVNPTFAGKIGSGRVNSYRGVTETIDPPRVKTMGGLPNEGGATSVAPTSFTLDVASVFDPATINLNAFELRGAGTDGTFGTSDDSLTPLSVVYGGASASDYKVGTNRLFFSINGTLSPDQYRFSMKQTAEDPFGQALDGNGDGIGGDAYERTFTLVQGTSPKVLRVLVSGSNSTHPQFDFSTVDGSGEQIRTIPLAGADTISVVFSENVNVASGNLTLVGHQGQTIPAVSQFNFDTVTNTATWEFASELPKGQYLMTLSDSITDLSSEALDGEFVNSWSVSEPFGNASVFPSGDGEAGGNFRFRFTNLPTDYNRNNTVDAADYTVWGDNFGITSGAQQYQGDGDGDGDVDGNDYLIWSTSLGTAFGQWPSVETGAILVSTTADENDGNYSFGDLSLREALAIAATNSGHDRIDFDYALFSTPQTIQIGIGNGHFAVTSDVTIAGPGANLLTVSGDMLYRVFSISSGVSATIEGMTITEGWVSSGNSGGGIYTAGNLMLDSVVVASNYAGSNGGGIYVASTGSLTLIDSTVDGNSATFGAGIFGHFGSGERLEISGSTISNNTLLSTGTGGGLNFFSVASGTPAVGKIVNSTFSGNSGSSGSASGGIRVRYLADLSIVNSTIATNTAGSGVGLHLVNNPTVTLHNTIIADNKTTGGNDSNISGTVNSTSSHNLIGPGGSGGLSNGTNGNIVLTTGQSAGLSELADYGGPTKTHTLLVGSPAIDAGDLTKALDLDGNTLVVDQRGRNRVVYTLDIGAVEREILGDYNSDGSVNAADYTVWRNNLGSTMQLVADGDGNGKVDQNDYDLWKAHYGNTNGPNLSAAYGIYVVSTNVDESDTNYTLGDLSLREALDLAGASVGQDQIVFRYELGGQTLTVNSSLGELPVDSLVDIVGLGASDLTISGGNLTRVFNVLNGTTASIRNLGIAEGYTTGDGGAIYSAGNLTLKGVAIRDSSANVGGAIYQTAGSLVVSGGSITDNTATFAGGAVALLYGAASSIESSTIARNSSTYVGGLYLYDTDLKLINSTVSSNTAASGFGGGAYFGASTSHNVQVTNSTFANNSAGSGLGGGIHVSGGFASPTLANTIVAGNTNNSGVDDVAGAFNTSSTYNVVGSITGSTGLTHPSNQTGTSSLPLNAGLAPLGFHGGPTETHALLNGSVAVNAGNNALALNAAGQPLTSDQRGLTRISETTVDVGAVEATSGSTLLVGTLVDENDSDHSPADFSLREALDIAGDLHGVEKIQFNPALTGTLTLALGELVVDADLELSGLGANQLTISGNNSSRVFSIATGVNTSLRSLRIANGNVSGNYGGGIISAGNLALDSVAVEDNYSLVGGGIYTTAGSLAVSNSTIADNEAAYVGGGVYTGNTAVSFVNVTISSNETAYAGGGLYSYNGSLSIDHSTITQNRVTGASSGGGIYVSTTGAQIDHSIVADNFTGTGTTENDISGSFSTSLSTYNLIGTGGSGGLTNGTNGNQVGVTNPGLASLDYYGGPTRTHALLAGSAAIDAGLASFIGPPYSDQRGKSRVADGNGDLDLRIDIGAFELAADEYFGTI